jgi:hypothetical protein
MLLGRSLPNEHRLREMKQQGQPRRTSPQEEEVTIGLVVEHIQIISTNQPREEKKRIGPTCSSCP